MRISDWSSDVCSSDLEHLLRRGDPLEEGPRGLVHADVGRLRGEHHGDQQGVGVHVLQLALGLRESGGKTVEEGGDIGFFHGPTSCAGSRWDEHTSELQSLMCNSYAVLCLKKKQQMHI